MATILNNLPATSDPVWVTLSGSVGAVTDTPGGTLTIGSETLVVVVGAGSRSLFCSRGTPAAHFVGASVSYTAPSGGGSPTVTGTQGGSVASPGTIELAGTVDSPSAGVARQNAPIVMASVNVSSAEILALNATAKQLLPALSGRNYYVLHKVVCHYRFMTTPYGGANGQSLAIGYGSVVADIVDVSGSLAKPTYSWPIYDFLGKTLLAQTADAYSEHTAVTGLGNDQTSWLATVIEAQPLSLASADAFTAGDGTLTIRLFYSIIDGAP